MTLKSKYFNSDLVIVIPAYNEEKSIKKVIKDSMKYGDVIVVNDGSTDKTLEIIKQMNAQVINRKKNQGYDNSIYDGIKLALKKNYKFVITIDADGELPVKYIPSFCKNLNKGDSLVLGIRSKKNRYIESFFGLLYNSIYKVSDPLCGMKGYDIQTLKSNKISKTYDSIGTELALKLISEGFSFSQINIRVKKRSDVSRFGNIIHGNLKIFNSMIKGFKYVK